MNYLIDVMIPMRGEWQLTSDLLTELVGQRDFERIMIYDNGSDDAQSVAWLAGIGNMNIRGVDITYWGPERGIYKMWNDAWRRSLQLSEDRCLPVYLAFLNNDIMVPPRFLSSLAEALHNAPDDIWITYPEWKMGWPSETFLTGELIRTQGTRNPGGMSGYAFMLDVRRHITNGLPFIDEQYIWYSGDGDLVTNVQNLGGTAAAVQGLPVGHLEKATSAKHEWTVRQGKRDMANWRRLHRTRHHP